MILPRWGREHISGLWLRGTYIGHGGPQFAFPRGDSVLVLLRWQAVQMFSIGTEPLARLVCARPLKEIILLTCY